MATDFGKLILEDLPEAVIATRADGEAMCWTRGAQALSRLCGKIALAQAKRAKALFPTSAASALRTPLNPLTGIAGAIQSSARRGLATCIALLQLSNRM